MTYLALAVGVAAVAASAAAWAGRWRGWTRTFITAHLPVPVTILPAFGLLMIAVPLHDSGPFTGSSALVGAALVVALMAFVLALWNPVWFGPRWYRELKASGDPIEFDLSDPLTASAYAFARADVDERALVAETFGDAPPAAAWRVSLVDGDVKIGGHLELHRDAVAFYPNKTEARTREEPFALILSKREVAGVRTTSAISLEIEERSGAVHRLTAFFPRRIAERIEADLVG